tara:strand:+ start:1610 stop:2404 length:795 start_codon:yes stop_codon:yes gene_type:complete
MTNLTPLRNFINEPDNDLGVNSWVLADLVKGINNGRMIDLGVRSGASSALMSIESEQRNNQVCGCDISFSEFFRRGRRFVNENYICYQADSVTLGKNWDEDPFDIIFVDTVHTREQVLAELYYWSNHIKEGGHFVFHDTHWVAPNGEDNPIEDNTYSGEIDGVKWGRPDVAVTEFFNLPKSVRQLNEYEDGDIKLKHCTESHGMTFVQVKTLDAIQRFKESIDWDTVFEVRNRLNNIFLNPDNPNFVDWNLDIENIDNELVINP